MSGYQKLIATILARRDITGTDPRHIEGYMRLGHGTLDGLSIQEFELEVTIGVECIKQDGVERAEANANSYGL